MWGHTAVEQLDYSYDPYARGTNVLMMPTAGDNVPANTGVAMGRVSDYLALGLEMTVCLQSMVGVKCLCLMSVTVTRSTTSWLSYVVEGDARLQRFEDNPINLNVIYDIDDVSDGTAEFSCGAATSAMIGESLCPDDVQDKRFYPFRPRTQNALRQIFCAKMDNTMPSRFPCFDLQVSTASTMHSPSVSLMPMHTWSILRFVISVEGQECGAHGRV